jgi:hypothetical protein
MSLSAQGSQTSFWAMAALTNLWVLAFASISLYFLHERKHSAVSRYWAMKRVLISSQLRGYGLPSRKLRQFWQ